MAAADAVADEPPLTEPGEAPHRRTKRRRAGLSIQSKLLIMMLAVSLVSSVVIGAIGFVSGRDSLREAAIDQLTTIRELRVGEIESEMRSIQQTVELNSRNRSAQMLSEELNAAWDDLQTRQLTPTQEAELEAYYADVFVPELEIRTGAPYSDTAFIPESAAGQWLQYHYTIQFPDFATALTVDDAGDGTPFSAVAGEHGGYVSRLVDQIGYEDVLVLNLDGDVVYSAYKGVDLGTNLDDGPYRESLFADAYRDVVASNSVETVAITDFERWIPSLGEPTMWVMSPIGDDEDISGVLAVQIAVETIDAVMTGDFSWAEQGLGETGEVYLAGPDRLMRSTARGLIEDPDGYLAEIVANDTAQATADQIRTAGHTVLLQPVETVSVDAALSGATGTSVSESFNGSESLTAYSPVEIAGLDWVAVAHTRATEAFAPVSEFTRNLVFSTLGILLAVSIASLLLAHVLTRPLRALVTAVRRVSAGELDVRVPAESRDEFGDLGANWCAPPPAWNSTARVRSCSRSTNFPTSCDSSSTARSHCRWRMPHPSPSSNRATSSGTGLSPVSLRARRRGRGAS